MDSLSDLQSLGLSWPSPAYIFGSILFGIIGYVAYRHGKHMERPKTRWVGFALMVYPYAVSRTWLLYVVGIALCAWLYFDRA